MNRKNKLHSDQIMVLLEISRDHIITILPEGDMGSLDGNTLPKTTSELSHNMSTGQHTL